MRTSCHGWVTGGEGEGSDVERGDTEVLEQVTEVGSRPHVEGAALGRAATFIHLLGWREAENGCRHGRVAGFPGGQMREFFLIGTIF